MQSARQTSDRGYRHVGAIFFRRAGELGDRTFIKIQRGTSFAEISWRAFAANVENALQGLYALGLKKGDRVAIVGENSLEWLCADMATLAGGFPNVAMASSLSETMTLKMLRHSGCRAAFVANENTVGKLLNLKGQLPVLAHIIIMDECGSAAPHTLTMGELRACGAR
jgi:long-subunit acyl-CoA synthetase (AMP-forming)